MTPKPKHRARRKVGTIVASAFVVAGLMAGVSGVIVVADPAPQSASAHAGNLHNKPECNLTTGQYDVPETLTWTNVPSNGTGTVEVRTGTSSFASGWNHDSFSDWTTLTTTSGASGSYSWSYSLPGTTTSAPWVYVYITWADGYTGQRQFDDRAEGLTGCATPPPPPGVASASLSVANAATCSQTSSESHAEENATLTSNGGSLDQSVGTHTAVWTVTSGNLFPAGTGVSTDRTTYSLQYEILHQDLSKCDTTAACTTTSTVYLNDLSTMYFDDRTKGHHELVVGGMHIWTDDSDSQSKSAGYATGSFALKDAGVPYLNYTNNSGQSEPGLNLTIYLNGSWWGNLTLEPLFPKYWASKVVTGALGNMPAGPNPTYQKSYGTLDDFLAAWESSGITNIRGELSGYSLGSGAKGDGLVTSWGAGCVNYVPGLTTNASAVVVKGAATCDALSTVAEGAISSAKWSPITYSGNDWTAVATANSGSAFASAGPGGVLSAGNTIETFTGSLDAAIGYQSLHPDAACFVAPTDAVAAVTVQAQTCTADGSASTTQTNATLDAVLDQSVGAHTAAWTAVVNHKFPAGVGVSADGLHFVKAYTIVKATGNQSTNPLGACYVLPLLAFTGSSGAEAWLLQYGPFVMFGLSLAIAGGIVLLVFYYRRRAANSK